MELVRFAVDLGSDTIGPFAYSEDRRVIPRLPQAGVRMPLDDERRHRFDVVTTTPGFDGDVETPIVWGRLSLEYPTTQEQLWDLDFRPGWFETFQDGRGQLDAFELIERVERRRRRRGFRHRRRKVTVGVMLGTATVVGAVAGVVGPDATKHVIEMAGNDAYDLLKAFSSRA
jgi:hypothetical protein